VAWRFYVFFSYFQIYFLLFSYFQSTSILFLLVPYFLCVMSEGSSVNGRSVYTKKGGRSVYAKDGSKIFKSVSLQTIIVQMNTKGLLGPAPAVRKQWKKQFSLDNVLVMRLCRPSSKHPTSQGSSLFLIPNSLHFINCSCLSMLLFQLTCIKMKKLAVI